MIILENCTHRLGVDGIGVEMVVGVVGRGVVHCWKVVVLVVVVVDYYLSLVVPLLLTRLQ